MQLHNVEDIYPLTPMQQGMIFHTLYRQESGTYVQQVVYTLDGTLDVDAFIRAWQQTLDRHPVLRTGFLWQDLDEPLQIVRQQVQLPWTQHDWRHESAEQQNEQIDLLLAEQRQRGFELDESPLMSCTLIRRAEERWWFIWNYHHIILDGWSVSVVLGDIFKLYHAFHSGATLALDTPPPYRSYIAWLQQQDQAAAETFWRQTLQGFSAATDLPGATSSGQTGTARRERQVLQLLEAHTATLRALAQRHHITLSTLVQGAWAILLSRYSGLEDVVFGMTTAGRPPQLPGIEAMVGLFINTLPVRAQVAGQARLIPWLQALQAQQVQRDQYAYSPLVDVQGWSAIPRGTPLFESLLVFENAPTNSAAEAEQSGLSITDVRFEGRTNYPLTIEVVPGPALVFDVRFDADRFAPAAVQRMLTQIETLLQAMATQPEQQLDQIRWLSAAEYQQIVEDWNTIQAPTDAARCLHQRFEEWAMRRPDAEAVVWAGLESQERAAWTYHDLDQRANQLARHLQTLGVGPEVRVAVYLDRSLDLILAILSVLKAGGAYVPIDPGYPAARVGFMIEDAAPTVLLTDQALSDQLAQALGDAAALPTVCVDSDWTTIAAHSATAPITGVTPDNLAYVIYTSGSTGKPKGSLVSHANVDRLFAATHDWFHFGVDDVWTLFHSAAFDFSVWELWGALCFGGRLVVVPYWVSRSPEAFHTLLSTERVTVLNQTPSAFQQLIQVDQTIEPVDRLALRLVIFGGEALHMPSLKPWFQRHGDQQPQLVNMYGITETTVHVTYYPISSADAEERVGSKIGVRIPDLQMYVLDSGQRPVPIGVTGELYIGGDGLARGYRNRPDLTAERFVPHPFSSAQQARPGARLYRTGDRACYLPDGTLQFIGRGDRQVKLRGFRIEPGEIEATLLLHSDVRAAAVVTREDLPGDRRLVAYIVPQLRPSEQAADADRTSAEVAGGSDGADADPTLVSLAPALRDLLRQHLPDYMIPAAFVLMEALPLTPNGKLDRAALPAPDSTRPELAATFVAPQTFVEEALVMLWRELLHIDQIGIYDNFFTLGGHSLLTMQLASRIHESLNVEVSVAELFNASTLAEMGTIIGQRLIEEEDPEKFDELLQEVQDLSPDELRALLQADDG